MSRVNVAWGVGLLALSWVSVFLLDPWFSKQDSDWIFRWAFDPAVVDRWLALRGWGDLKSVSVAMILAQLVHLDAWHLIGNVAFFIVFGAQVERVIGGFRLIALTLFLGSVAYLVPALIWPSDLNKVVGASGAVSGILGVYLTLCAQNKVRFWLPLGVVIQKVQIGAGWVILAWLGVQLIFLADATKYASVAVESHLVGFFAGLVGGLVWRWRMGPKRWQHIDS